jgi:signal transduction histidine kinase
MWPRSLASRLIVSWIFGSMLAFFTTPATVHIPLAFFLGADHRLALEVWTTKRARDIVVSALRRGADGKLMVGETEALRNHCERNPHFRFAVFDPSNGALLAGSSVELAKSFEALMGNVEVYGSLFHLSDDPNPNARGYVRTTLTPFGRLGTIVYGADFHWDDVLYQLRAYLVTENLLAYLPLCALISLIGYRVVRGSLAPLRAAAVDIGDITVDRLSQRVPNDNLPSEIQPFIDAVNAALQRVREGVARQKRFTANSAHELRTPIAILCARLDRMEECPLKIELQRDALRIRTILEQLLVLAQIDERGDDRAPPTLDLGEVVLAAIADLMPIAYENRRQIEFDAPGAPVPVHAYHWAVESVVTNLIENALRAEPQGGAILVRVTSDAIVEVIDHGPGVAPPDRELIFEPFWRKSDATPGVGLGLAIAKELMEKQHGRLWVEETVGGGASFKLAFVSAGPAAAPVQ